MGENVKYDVKGDTLTVTVDLKQNLGKSASGKTDLVAKCRENLKDGITLQVNVFKKRKES